MYLGAIARFVLVACASRGITISEDASMQIVLGAVALGSLVWSLAQKKVVAKEIKDARGF
jgi:hypothetical protein